MSNPTQEITPDQLLESFRGRSFKSVILFTVIVHAILICGTSVPYLIKLITGESTANLSEQERTELAATEVAAAMREIATKHGLKPQDLSTHLAGSAAPVATKVETPPPTEKTAAPTPEEPVKPKTAIEKKLDVKEDGPKVPVIPTEEATNDDLFK